MDIKVMFVAVWAVMSICSTTFAHPLEEQLQEIKDIQLLDEIIEALRLEAKSVKEEAQIHLNRLNKGLNTVSFENGQVQINALPQWSNSGKAINKKWFWDKLVGKLTNNDDSTEEKSDESIETAEDDSVIQETISGDKEIPAHPTSQDEVTALQNAIKDAFETSVNEDSYKGATIYEDMIASTDKEPMDAESYLTTDAYFPEDEIAEKETEDEGSSGEEKRLVLDLEALALRSSEDENTEDGSGDESFEEREQSGEDKEVLLADEQQSPQEATGQEEQKRAAMLEEIHALILQIADMRAQVDYLMVHLNTVEKELGD